MASINIVATTLAIPQTPSHGAPPPSIASSKSDTWTRPGIRSWLIAMRLQQRQEQILLMRKGSPRNTGGFPSARSTDCSELSFGLEEFDDDDSRDDFFLSDAPSIHSRASQNTSSFSFLTEVGGEDTIRTFNDHADSGVDIGSLGSKGARGTEEAVGVLGQPGGLSSSIGLQQTNKDINFTSPSERLDYDDRVDRSSNQSIFLLKNRKVSAGFRSRRGITIAEINTNTSPDLRSPAVSPPARGVTRKNIYNSPATSPNSITSMVNEFDFSSLHSGKSAGHDVEQSASQRMMEMMDECELTLNNGTKTSFRDLRENLARKGVTCLSIITISHFISDKVVAQFEETKLRMQNKLGHSDFHILVVGFGPEKFINSFCSTIGVQTIDINSATLPEAYSNQTHAMIGSDPSRAFYAIMTAYQVSRLALSKVSKSGLMAEEQQEPCSQMYSNSFRAYSRLTAPSTTGSGKQYLAWAVLDLEDEKVVLFELDTNCKY